MSRKREKYQLVELGTQFRVLQALLNVLQTSRSALSIERNTLYSKEWNRTILGLSEELHIMRENVNNLQGDLMGYLDFCDSECNEFCKVVARIDTLDAAQQTDAPARKHSHRRLPDHRSERSSGRYKRRDHSGSLSGSSTSPDNYNHHNISSEASDDHPGWHSTSPSDRTYANLVELVRLQPNTRGFEGTTSYQPFIQGSAVLQILLTGEPFAGLHDSRNQYGLQVYHMDCPLAEELLLQWRNPILVLGFLSEFMSEADILRMSEGQAHIALPYILRGVAEVQFLSI